MTREDIFKGKELIRKMEQLEHRLRILARSEHYWFDGEWYKPKNMVAWEDFVKAERNLLESELLALETELEAQGK